MFSMKTTTESANYVDDSPFSTISNWTDNISESWKTKKCWNIFILVSVFERFICCCFCSTTITSDRFCWRNNDNRKISAKWNGKKRKERNHFLVVQFYLNRRQIGFSPFSVVCLIAFYHHSQHFYSPNENCGRLFMDSMLSTSPRFLEVYLFYFCLFRGSVETIERLPICSAIIANIFKSIEFVFII